jgi:DNA (cytosine-5)-methyltransferase 1
MTLTVGSLFAGDLAALGYDAEWDCIRASDFGAPHQRNRLWLVAYLPGDAHGLVADPGGLGGAVGRASLHLGRVADGIPARVDRLTALGNALVPQIAQWIGERLVAHEAISADRAEAA